MGELFDSGFLYFSGLLEVLLEIIFYGRFVGKKGTIVQNILFIILGCMIVNLPTGALLKLAIFTVALFMYGVLVLKASGGTAILYAILTAEIMQLCFGIIGSVTMVLSSFLYEINPTVFSKVFMIAGNLLALCLTCLCYWIVFKCLANKEDIQNQYVLIILTPLLMIFVVSEYISHTFYGNIVSAQQASGFLISNHIQMLAVQALGIISIFAMMYAYQKLSVAFSASRKLSLLEQQSHFQKQYVEEAQAHYDSTKSLRHDMKNHVLIIKGLLENADYEKAKAYIEEMDIVTANLSFPFQTGNAVLDVLLENKAALAANKGITVSSTLKVPFPCSVGDMDFCIILSNALDNAIHACEKLGMDEKKYIRISSSRQKDFLLIEIENSFNGSRHFKQGIGLSNIKWVTEKYGGAVDISIEDKSFCLSVLLVISQQPQNISQQTY